MVHSNAKKWVQVKGREQQTGILTTAHQKSIALAIAPADLQTIT
jgi:hypothetical protein